MRDRVTISRITCDVCGERGESRRADGLIPLWSVVDIGYPTFEITYEVRGRDRKVMDLCQQCSEKVQKVLGICPIV